MKKFILNLITVVAWIYQVVLWFTAVSGVIFTGIFIFGRNNPDLRKGFMIGLKATSQNHPINQAQLSSVLNILCWMFAFGIIGCIIQILICRYVKKIIKNIKIEVYFDNENLFWIARLSIAVASYVVLNIISYFIVNMLYKVYPFFGTNNSIQNITYPSSIITGIMFLVVFYVVYIVFKYGLKLQQDSNEII